MMDRNSGKRVPTYQNPQFCNRIGCQGRIKYTNTSTNIGSSRPHGNQSISSTPVKTKAISPSLDSKRKSPSQSKFDRVANIGTSSSPSSIAHRKIFQSKQNSSVQADSPSPSRSYGLATPNNSTKSRCLKSLKSNLKSDGVPSSGSKLAAKNVIKQSPDGETSLLRKGRNTSLTDMKGSSGAASVRTRRSTYVNGRSTCRQPSSGFPASGRPTGVGSLSQLQQPSSGWSSYSPSISNNEDHLPFGSALRRYNMDELRRYNLDEMSEVRMELGRIDQDAEMAHEQMLALEASLYLSNVGMYDQHRDMRLDIDDMSYEELLALGESMGTVSTALSEDALSKCMTTSVYPSQKQLAESSEDGDDVNCSICQDEYETGDEIGKLVECQHVYHTRCIHQWLKLKNWCPICKTDVAPQKSS